MPRSMRATSTSGSWSRPRSGWTPCSPSASGSRGSSRPTATGASRRRAGAARAARAAGERVGAAGSRPGRPDHRVRGAARVALLAASRAAARARGQRQRDREGAAGVVRPRRAPRGLGRLQVDRPACGAARAGARASAQPGRAGARLSRSLRVLADARRARRDLAAEPAGRSRGPPVGDLGAHQGRDRRGPARAPRPRRPASRCRPGTTRTRSSRMRRRPATIRSRRRSSTSIRSRSPAATSRRSATTSTACSRAATSIRATARTSTRSVPTSTAATTCACSRTASRGRAGSATMVHELGHAVYDLAIDAQLPWLLRQPAHTFTTEAIAMLHGRLVRDEAFLERFAARRAGDRARSAQRRDAAPRAARLRALGAGHDALRARALPRSGSGSRRGLVAARRALPARHAAGRAAPDDWACKIHVALAPVYYQNYLLGEVTASQLACGAGARDRRAEPGRRAGRGGRVPARALHAPGRRRCAGTR